MLAPEVHLQWSEVSAGTRGALADAIGQRLACDLVALVGLPSADQSAMDRWAVAGSPPWRVVGDQPAGARPAGELLAGECRRIATGAVVPQGAVAILPVEASSLATDGVRPIDADWQPRRRHVRRAGEEASKGDVLLRAGAIVTPPVAGLAAAGGHDDLLGSPRARVDVYVLGDELIDQGIPDLGRTRDALGPQLPAWLTALDAAPRGPSRVPDRLPDLVAALSRSDADVIVTTGGTSVGPRDYIHAAVAALGGRLVVDGVNLKPGHPMLLAALPGGRWLAGLPGNPFAACIAMVTLMLPLLTRLHDEQPLMPVTAKLTTAEPSRPGDGHRLLPVRAGADGRVEVLPSCGAAMLRGLAAATGLAVIGPEGADDGDEIQYLSLPW
jgi:molybdopterin molybdotransferase